MDKNGRKHNESISKIYLPFLLSWICGLSILLLSHVTYSSPGLYDCKGKDMALCQVHVMDLCTPFYPDFYCVLKQTVKNCRCLVVSHPTDNESNGGNGNRLQTETRSSPSLPEIIVNGTVRILVSPGNAWQKELIKALEQNLAIEKWPLDIYLSCRQSRDKSMIVDFSVCNLAKHGNFNGKFTLWLAEVNNP